MKISGSLVERNGKYYAVYRVDGKQKWKCLNIPTTTGNKRKAEKALNSLMQMIEDGNNNDYNLLFVDYLDVWLEKVEPFVKPSTWESYCKHVNGKIKPYFSPKKIKLRELKVMHLNDYFVFLRNNGRCDGKGGLSEKTVCDIKSTISKAIKYAFQNYMLEEDVSLRCRLPIFEQKEKEFEPTIYTGEQIKLLLDYAIESKNKLRLFLFLEMFTGARKGELCALTWDKVDFQNKTISISLNRTGSRAAILKKTTTPKTKNGYRTIKLPEKVFELLREEKRNQEENRRLLKSCYFEYDFDYVIRQEDGRIYNPNSINRIIRRMTDKLGLPPCRVHDYRHAVATMLFDQGIMLKDITLQLGHGQTSTTEKIYIKKTRITNDENAEALSRAIGI